MPLSISKFIDPSVPAELILEVVRHFTFGTGESIRALFQTHPRFRSILQNYERSITKSFIWKELPHTLIDFPNDEGKQGYKWLTECVTRYDVLDDIMAIMISESNCHAVEDHNTGMVNTGLLLLYRLNGFKTHSAKLHFLKSLSLDPLTAIYLAIQHATLTARYHGEGRIHQRTYGRFMDAYAVSLRCDIEHCFAEGCMQLGPSFINATLLASANAEPTLLNLYHDHAEHDWDLEQPVITGGIMPPITQGPHRDPLAKETSLWTVLLERLSELMGCRLDNVRGAVEEDVEFPDHSLAWLGKYGREKLLMGLDVDE